MYVLIATDLVRNSKNMRNSVPKDLFILVLQFP